MWEDYFQVDALDNLNVKCFEVVCSPVLYIFQVVNITFLYGFQIIIIIIMVIFKCYFSGELIALSLKKYIYKKKQKKKRCEHRIRKTNRLKALCMMQIKK